MCGNTCCDPSKIKVTLAKCPECGTDNLAGVAKCIGCGALLAAVAPAASAGQSVAHSAHAAA